MSTYKTFASTLVPYLVGVSAAFLVAGVLLSALGYNVLVGYRTIFLTSFSNFDSFALTLLKFIPLLLMSLGFAIPLLAQKYNVGIEGQFLLGAIGASIIGLTLNLPQFIHVLLALTVGVLLGSLWALVPALLLYKFNVNEIISTILMNFIAFYLVDYVATGPWRDVAAGHPMTIPIASTASLPLLVKRPAVHVGIILAVLVVLASYSLLYKTGPGYEIRATGANPRASQVFGINVKLIGPLTIVLGGAVSGLAGAMEVTGFHLRLIGGMQANYTPLGILIALMARGNPLALIFISFFISIIEIGSNALQRTQGVPVELTLIVEALILVFFLVAQALWRR